MIARFVGGPLGGYEMEAAPRRFGPWMEAMWALRRPVLHAQTVEELAASTMTDRFKLCFVRYYGVFWSDGAMVYTFSAPHSAPNPNSIECLD